MASFLREPVDALDVADVVAPLAAANSAGRQVDVHRRLDLAELGNVAEEIAVLVLPAFPSVDPIVPETPIGRYPRRSRL